MVPPQGADPVVPVDSIGAVNIIGDPVKIITALVKGQEEVIVIVDPIVEAGIQIIEIDSESLCHVIDFIQPEKIGNAS